MYICMDIGGTAIKYGTADANGVLITQDAMPTEALSHGGPGIVQKVCHIVESLRGDAAEGVAISTAGMVDTASCTITYALPSSIPNYTGTNWRTVIEGRFSLPCSVENDVNCAALGELWKGAGKGAKSLFAITVGTSIGGCLIVDGHVVHGTSASAGEIAYMRVPSGRLHENCSATRLVKDVERTKALPEGSLDGKQVFALLDEGDASAKDAVEALIASLADAITNIVCVANPDCIILGGGIMAREAVLRPLLEARLRERLVPSVYGATKVAFAATQNTAGMLGALYHFLQEHRVRS